MKKEKMKLFLLYPQPAPAAGSRDSGCWVVVEVMMGRRGRHAGSKNPLPKEEEEEQETLLLI